MRFAESKEVVAAETIKPIDDIYKERTLRSAADRHIDTVEAVGAAPTGSTTFTIDPKTQKEINKWIKREDKKTNRDFGSIGGHITYEFTPTSIGVVIVVRHSITKASHNFTDFSTW